MFRIAKRYLDGLATLHLHLRVRPSDLDGDAHEFCAVVTSDRRDIGRATDLSYVSNGLGVPGEVTHVWAFGTERDSDWKSAGEDSPDVDKPMLVHIVKPREQGQVRVRRAFSLLKGLAPLNDCPIIRAYSTKHPKARLIPLPAFVDRELRVAGGAAAPQEHELPKEIVERGPQVVAELPDDESDTRIGRLPIETEDVLARVAIELTDDAAIFLVDSPQEGPPLGIERGQVLVRAFKSPIEGF
jgi:hypothetical protein